MRVNGLVSTICDPNIGAIISDTWAENIIGLGANAVRAPIITADDGSMPTALYCRGLDIYARHGLPVLCVLTRGFQPVHQGLMFPNMALNPSGAGNPLLSPYIDAYTLRAEAVARQMVGHGATRWVVANEPNLSGLIPQGVDTTAIGKQSAMSPETFAALCWQGAHRLHAVGVTDVYCGSLSVLPGITGLDAANPYYATYAEHFYTFLAQNGQRAPFPWQGWSLNVENLWPAGMLARAVAVLRRIMTKHGDTGVILFGEYGITNQVLPGNEAALDATYQQVTTEAAEAYWFQHFGLTPYLGPVEEYTGWGCTRFQANGHALIPAGDYNLAPVVRRLFAT